MIALDINRNYFKSRANKFKLMFPFNSFDDRKVMSSLKAA